MKEFKKFSWNWNNNYISAKQDSSLHVVTIYPTTKNTTIITIDIIIIIIDNAEVIDDTGNRA